MMTINIRKNDNQISFKSLKPIPLKAYKIGGSALKSAVSDLNKLSSDVDILVIAKKGFFSKIKSLIFFVTQCGEKSGEWSSLSIDPKKLMPAEHRYKTVSEFNAKDIIESVEKAKNRLQKRNPHLPKPILPADSVYLAKFIEKFKKSCSI